MLIAVLAIVVGFVVLVWSADKFVDGASASASHLGMPPLLVGMIVVGFGTSAPEMVVSALASMQGNPGLALGNAYGSNIVNIALILGVTALIAPIMVHSSIVKKEIPILLGVTLLSGALILDGNISRFDAWAMLGVFFALIGWSIYAALAAKSDALAGEMAEELQRNTMPLKRALMWLLLGLTLLVASSRLLVWGSVTVAHTFGVSDLIIGLTIVALGTSLPELATSVLAARKNEHDIAVGNIVGSNLFNTLAVVGIAGAIHPMTVLPEVLSRDWPVMMALTVLLFLVAYGYRREGRINRFEGSVLLIAYIAYTGWLMKSVL